MPQPLRLDPMRLFPSDPQVRRLASDLFDTVETLPIISPHGHVDPAWFSADAPFSDPVSVFLTPDHYVLRMLYSHGIGLNDLGLEGGGLPVEQDQRAVWRLFASHYHLFLGTPSRTWLDHVFASVFDLDQTLTADSADLYFDTIAAALVTAAFRPRALFERFKIEVLATTEGALDDLKHHGMLHHSGWSGRIITTFRPDDVVDPDRPDFRRNLESLAQKTNEDVGRWDGYLNAIRTRRGFFREVGGATATDHGHPTARTGNLSKAECQALLTRVAGGHAEPGDAELFRAQMLTEMALMSCEDGMVMQLHPGSWRNHNAWLFETYGRDKGADIPTSTDYVSALKPLLDVVGNCRDLTLILFTLDETAYARELAPLAGHYPCLRLGPAWWFHDSPQGMLRFRQQTTETAGFYNSVGFNDDTRAFFSIPARHDVARRMDSVALAELVATHRMDIEDAQIVLKDLTYTLPKAAYKL